MRSSVAVLLLNASLCCVAVAGFAQQKGEGEGRRAKEGGDPAAMADFQKALAVQANDDQKEQLTAIGDACTAIAKALQENNKAKTDAVMQSISVAQKNWKDFAKDLSKPQRSFLKPLLQNASHREAEFERAGKGLVPNQDQVKKEEADAVRAANLQFLDALRKLADEMGVELKP